MKNLKLNSLLVLFASFAVFIGCNDAESEVVSPYVGNYVISNASLSDSLVISTNEIGIYAIPIGTDITIAIQTALLSAANCTSADKSYVELRKDNSMYMSCELQNAFNAGTWAEIDATTLKLNMNNTAIPTSPAGFALTVSNIVLSTTELKGTTSVPLPKAMISAMVPQLTLTSSNPELFIVNLSITFIKK